jgi:hypothetical protein
MTTTLIGYARCSTDKQDLAAQQAVLEKLGVAPERIYTDRGLTGATRARPGLDTSGSRSAETGHGLRKGLQPRVERGRPWPARPTLRTSIALGRWWALPASLRAAKPRLMGF